MTVGDLMIGTEFIYQVDPELPWLMKATVLGHTTVDNGATNLVMVKTEHGTLAFLPSEMLVYVAD